MAGLAEAGAALLGGVLRGAHALPGGDLSSIVRVSLADGREAIVKGGAAPRIEAEMLKAIAASGAPAPAVLAVSDEALVIEAVRAGGALDGAWASLGEVLATLHAVRGPSYGWPEDYAFGPIAIANGWMENWPDFWAERRLLVHSKRLSPPLAHRIEGLAADLSNRLPARPVPVLLHGDLWGGNVLADRNRVCALIDPACYFGHAEVDIAMLGLFDRPAPPFYETYGGLQPGHKERLTVYRLWPALVHLRLFGARYEPMAGQLLSQAGV
jgi:fructosamine-3-kinase